MASASRALLLARLRPLPAYRVVRPLAAAGSLLPARPWLSPAVAPGTAPLSPKHPWKTNYGHRPPKETTVPDGCDFEHWLAVMEPPPGDRSNPDVPRDEIVDGCIATLAQVVGSVEKARKKIYSVSTRHYFAFGARISEELSYKLKGLPKVLLVLPDSYMDAENKDCGGEPFINGKAVPYDPKYHEEWMRNNNARVQRNHRPHNSDRSYVRRENMQNFQNRDAPTMHHAKGNMPPPPAPLANNGDPPTTYQHHVQSPQACDTPGSGQNFQQCGALVHQVDDNQDRQDNPGGESQGYPNNHDDNLHTYQANAYNKSNNNGRQGGCSCYQNGSAAGQPPLHGANAPSHQGCYRGQAVHHHYNCHVHYHALLLLAKLFSFIEVQI
ncbi:hypothetical protein SETIT_2G268000v2 [Setaria italica]|uniref:MORF/ORRM1/DAG-like MORF domain-containing protein n=1 Tax=Setaria italica TaxID=4555 RepID=A0A368Q331_SETIT|nr:hypothetical protein SETIT_2G268000v2 [Setaria italica]